METKNYTLEKPDLLEQGDGKRFFTFGDQKYSLVEFSQESIQNFGISQDNASAGLLSINESTIFTSNIPPQFLKYALINEVLCPDVLENPGSCKTTLIEELRYVPKEIMSDYLLWRARFFKNMYGFYIEDIEGPSEDDKAYGAEMKDCYEYLKELVEPSNTIIKQTQEFSTKINKI